MMSKVKWVRIYSHNVIPWTGCRNASSLVYGLLYVGVYRPLKHSRVVVPTFFSLGDFLV